MITRPKITAYTDRQVMADTVAAQVADVVEGSIATRGAASLAVSGGSTPAALYAALSRRPVDWSKVSVPLVDERWVSSDHEASNERFLKETLLRGNASAATPAGLWSAADTPAEGLARAEARLEDVSFPLDVVVLGMGVDGHTASWFPHAAGLASALVPEGPRLAAVRARRSDVTGPYVDRITMTLGAVSSAKLIVLLLAGEDKRLAYEAARLEGPVADMPVRAILDARPDMTVAWAP